MRTCEVPGCERPHNSHGLCSTHGGRLLRHGDVQADVPVRARFSRDRDRWFCECVVPEWNGVECVRCRRKPRARMKVAV